MEAILAAALLMCSTGDPHIADQIIRESIAQDTNVVVALTVGIMESGLHSNNTMGVQGCYPAALKKTHRTTNECIRIGVTSIHNRLWDAHTKLPSKADFQHCSGTGNMEMCRALAVYNGADKGRKWVYARTAMGIIRSIYRITKAEIPKT